jgi:hypothetical protein
MVKIWETGSGECLQSLDIGKELYNISVDATGSYLNSEIGTIAIDPSSGSNMILSVINPLTPPYQGAVLSSDERGYSIIQRS